MLRDGHAAVLTVLAANVANVTALTSFNIPALAYGGAPALYQRLHAKAATAFPGLEEATAAIAAERLLYVNQAGSANLSAAALELDTVILGLSLLTVMHAMLHHRLSLLPLFLLVGIVIEQLAVRVGQTHCHSEALLMLSQCSSGSSVARLYTCRRSTHATWQLHGCRCTHLRAPSRWVCCCACTARRTCSLAPNKAGGLTRPRRRPQPTQRPLQPASRVVTAVAAS